MSNFKKGDRVRVINALTRVGKTLLGKTGVVIVPGDGISVVGVELDDPFPQGHNLDGLITKPNGRWFDPSNIELADDGLLIGIETLFDKDGDEA